MNFSQAIDRERVKMRKVMRNRFNREPTEKEEAHMETDALALAQHLMVKVAELEDRITALEKRSPRNH